MPKDNARKSITLAIVMAALACGAAQGQQPTYEYDIVGPPSQDLRRTIAAAANDYLTDLPVVKGSEISDEIALPGARKLHAVCVRWKSIDQVGGNPPFSPMYVTLTAGFPESAWRNDSRCQDPKLKFYPFPEMR
jgi:hypothetical protein